LLCLAEILPRHTLTASLLWIWLAELLAGLSPKAAFEKLRLPFALETFYRLRRKLRERLDSFRSWLCRIQQPPGGAHADSLLQTIDHLRRVFPCGLCAPADFQLHFQRPFLG
jgi:hypothetical protein